MASWKILLLLALGFPYEEAALRPANSRNTIFADERLKGEVFNNVDAFDSFDLSPRSDSPYRLPNTTRPEHYTMFLTINITELSYSGTVEIQLYATQANVNEIVLHSDYHALTSVVLTQGSTAIPTTYTQQEEGQLLRVQLTSGSLDYVGESRTIYNLTIMFNAALREDTQGLYKSWYRNAYNEEVRWMASTQFSPTSARYAFPCYDEPSYKATFDVTIRRPTTHRSWFCTRLWATNNSDVSGYQEDIFARSPFMSTYVFGLIVAEYESLVVTSNNILMHEVIARPGAISAGQGTYALNTAQALLAEMSYETDYDYYSQHPDLKMTQAAIPNFHFGAMENWGLLTYSAFDTVVPADLFRSLEVVANQSGALIAYGPDFNFSEYYRSWTEQSGHPVLNVQVDHHTGDMTIYQRRFNINTGFSATGTNYIIPVTFATASNPDFENTKPTHILHDAITVINRGSIGDEWVLFNKQQTGYYRVNYDDYTWDLNVIALRGANRTLIHEYNRAQIVNDVFSFARSGLMSYNRAFNILSFLQFETAYAPWVAAITGFSWIRNRLAGTVELERLDSLIALWSTAVMDDLTYYPTSAEKPFMRTYLRYQLAPTMCLIGAQDCLNAALDQFAALRSTAATEVPVDSRGWVYCNGLRYGTNDDFNFLWNRFLQHNVYSEKNVILSALGCTSDPTSLNTLLNNIVEDNYVIRSHDYNTALSAAVNGNEANTQIVFTYIQNNLQAFVNAYGNAVTPLSYVSARLRTITEIEAFQVWAIANQAALGNDFTAVYNGAELSRQSIEWVAEVQSDMNSYFSNGDQPIQTSTAATQTSTDASITPQPSIAEPVTPNIPVSGSDTGVSSILSAVVIVCVIFVNITL